MHQILVHFLGGAFLQKKGAKNDFLAKMLAADQSNAPYIYIYIPLYAVELLSGPSLGVLEVIIWSKFVFLKHRLPKNTVKIGVSAQF